MTSERWQRVKEIFQSGLERAPAERSVFLASACGGDEALLKEVESLIAANEKDGSFIDSPAYEAAADISDEELKPGQTIGQYEILSTLGKGGMGEVYLANDRSLGRKVALKVLPSGFTRDRERLRRFEQEARAVSALNHPNILTIYEIGYRDSRHYIATEFIDGETLRQRLARARMGSEEASATAAQIASALVSAHAEGIIHRDIKPENVMLRRDGIVKVLDFGLAKLVQAKEGKPEDPTRPFVKTDIGVVMGTVTYMSPEQARGLEVDARTDIWSLGVMLYEMLSGQAPFNGATTSDVIAAILEREPKSLLGTSSGVPDALEWIVNKALTKDREGRYQTTRELLNDLQRLKQRPSMAGEPERGAAMKSEIHSATRREAANGPRPRKMVAWAAGVAMLALVATIAVWKGRTYWFRDASQTPVVVLMDSPLPDRVYDPETRKNGGTNADDITDILRDLPIVIEKENTSPLWHREDQVLRENPALIVIHHSCFADSTVGVDPRAPALQVADKKLESFLGYIGLGNPNTRFLVYTRRSGDQSLWVTDMEKRFPQLAGRLHALTIAGGPEHATFRDPETTKMVRQNVKSILGVQ